MINFTYDRPLIDQPVPGARLRPAGEVVCYEALHDLVGELRLRPFEPADQTRVQRLYAHGLMTRQIEPFDPAADLDNMDHTYMRTPGSHAWVVEYCGRIVGLAAVTSNKAHELEVRRLLVDAGRLHDHVMEMLLRQVLAYCRRNSVLKILLLAGMDSLEAGQLLSENGYHCTRHKVCRGRRMAEFYVNLYQKMPREAASA